MQYIKIHSLDNVAVALADLAEGTEVTFDNQSVTLRRAIGRGHKFALIPIARGERGEVRFAHRSCAGGYCAG